MLAAIADDTVMSIVNFAEIATYYARNGAAEEHIRDLRSGVPFELIAFDDELAIQAALLTPVVRRAGLSLGDRACLALSVPAITADRAWATIGDDIAVPIHIIR